MDDNKQEFDKFQTALNVLEDGVYIINREYEIKHINYILEKEFGPIDGQKCFAYFHDREEPCPWCKNEEVFAGKTVHWDFHIAKTGKDYELIDIPYVDFDGESCKLEIVRDVTERKRAEELIRRDRDTKATINTLLHLALKGVALEEILRKALVMILSIPWLSVESRGCILLVKEPGYLAMTVEQGLEVFIREICARVPFGKCYCGRAALTGELQFADNLSAEHEITYEGIAPHGHYCVPIKSADRVFGVLNIYTAEGHLYNEQEVEFLNSVTDLLAGIIERKQMEEEHKRLSLIVEETTDFVSFAGLDKKILYINRSGKEMLGHTAETDLSTLYISDVHPAWAVKIIMEEALTALDRDGIWAGETALLTSDGKEIPVSQLAHAHRGSDGNVEYLATIARDISERKRNELFMTSQIEVLKMITKGVELSETLNTLIQNMESKQMGAKGVIMLLDESSNTLKPVAAPSLSEDYLRDIESLSTDPAAAACCQCAANALWGKNDGVIGAADAPLCAEECRIKLKYGFRACLGAPILSPEGKHVGTLTMYYSEPNATKEEEMRFVDSACLLVGLAIEHDYTLKELRRRLRETQALRNIDMAITGSLDLRVTFQVVLDEVTGMLSTDAAAILLLDPYSGTLRYEQWRGFHSKDLKSISLPLGKGYGGRAATERQSIHIADLSKAEPDPVQGALLVREGFVAYFAVPLIAKGTLRGVLEVYHREPVETDGDWLAFLETLAGQAAIAVDNAELFARLEHSSLDLLQAYDATIEGWAHALDLKDEETEDHSQRVTEMTVAMARKMNIKDEELAHVRRGALLHDIGKMGIPDKILLKPGKLSDEEWAVMKKHPAYAYEMLAPVDYLRPALDIPYCHHEKWDGTGYPRGLKGKAIPLAARIFAVVDVYDALTSNRPYREAWSKEKTLALIKEESGMHFDPDVVEVFLKESGNQT